MTKCGDIQAQWTYQRAVKHLSYVKAQTRLNIVYYQSMLKEQIQ